MNELPWSERVVMLSLNPGAATPADVARLTAELMEAKKALSDVAIMASGLRLTLEELKR